MNCNVMYYTNRTIAINKQPPRVSEAIEASINNSPVTVSYLEAIVGPVIFDRQYMIVDREDVSMSTH